MKKFEFVCKNCGWKAPDEEYDWWMSHHYRYATGECPKCSATAIVKVNKKTKEEYDYIKG